ncbi:MAG: PLP-dependent aminotransferase family protein [Pseudomonadota bacterium]
MSTSPFTLSRRSAALAPSALREIFRLTERADIVSLAGGLPPAACFPLDALRDATQRVLADPSNTALQYGPSEGHRPLREWVAADLCRRGMPVSSDQVLITTGSQQGLDLVGKVLVDPGSPVAVEAPTYLGALQAFSMSQPRWCALEADEEGPLPQALDAVEGARFMYLLPNFQNPTGRSISAARRLSLMAAAQAADVPVVEDDPYGELWFDEPPPPPLGACWPQGTVYLGSFSKVLAPGLRLGYLVAPDALMPKIVQAKQAADLHSPSFDQRVVHEVLQSGCMATHLPRLRAHYRSQRDRMQQALAEHLPAGCQWQVPQGGMFFWVTLPVGWDAQALFPWAVEQGVAFVPGASFYALQAAHNTLRLSFVTVPPDRMQAAVAALAEAMARYAAQRQREPHREAFHAEL